MKQTLHCINCGAGNYGFNVVVTEDGIHCQGRCVTCGMESHGHLTTGVDFLAASQC